MQTQPSSTLSVRATRPIPSPSTIERPVHLLAADAVRAVTALERTLTVRPVRTSSPSPLGRLALRLGTALLTWATRDMPASDGVVTHQAQHAARHAQLDARERSRAELRRLHLER